MESLKKGPSSTRSYAAPPADDILSLVGVGLSEPEGRLLRDVAQQAGWRFQRASSCREAMARLCLERTPVIISSAHLADGTWEDLLSGTATQNNRPRLIVISPHADERLWLDVLTLGGFDVLPSPLAEPEIRRAVELAWNHWIEEVRQESWRRQYAAAAS
jgi:DNA-binding NtrC family response regulator